MGDLAKISEVAKTFDVSPSTLRYWEKVGLVSFRRRNQNNYREFTFESLVALCDIILYRNLEFPLNTIKDVKYQTEEELSQTLLHSKENIDQQIRKLNQVKDDLIKREKLLRDFQIFKKQGLEMKATQLEAIYHFSFKDKEAVQHYLSDPSCAINIYAAHDDEVQYGIFLEQNTRRILRKKDTISKTYLYGLFWSNESGESNKDDFIRFAQKHQISLGDFICQYILSSYDAKKGYCHYFEGWVEVIK